jgi:hypothetical protein
MMAVLALDRVWINRLDTGESVAAPSDDRGLSYEMAGDVRTYAGGRQRAVLQEGVRGAFGFRLVWVDADMVATLKEWMGIPIQVRDHRGQIFTGVYFSVTPTEHKGLVYFDVAISLRFVTVEASV